MGAQAFTVYDMLVRGAALAPDASALIQGPREWSFRQLRERADSLATGLAGLGLSKGDRICVLAQNDAAYVDLYGACARQGLVAYPINWRLTAPEVERVLERAAPKMLVADASTLPVVGDWPRTRRAVAHWYQLGEAPAPGSRTRTSSPPRSSWRRASASPPRTATFWRCRCSTSPRSATSWRTCTRAEPVCWWPATMPRRRCA